MLKKQLYILCIAVMCNTVFVSAQTYHNHYGTGNDIAIKASGSSEENNSTAASTLNGTGYFPDLPGAARFLSQATLGYNWQQITDVYNLGIKNWLEVQFNTSATSYYAKYDSIYNYASNLINNSFEFPQYQSFTFYDIVLKQPDALRQKVAFATRQWALT